MSDQSAEDVQPDAWWFPIWEFFVHAVVGTALFILIAAPAIGINLFLSNLEDGIRVSKVIIYALTGAEYVILATDMMMFIIFMVRAASRTIKKL